MATKTPKILVIAGNPKGISFLVARLKKRACDIHIASSCKEANTLVSSQQFDLVLSEFKLRDGSSYPLAASLVGSGSTLIYSYPLESGCCWLPAIRNGQSCWGSMAMRPSEFIGFLDEIFKDIETGSRLAKVTDDGSHTGFKVMA
jgi:hypothetical protein